MTNEVAPACRNHRERVTETTFEDRSMNPENNTPRWKRQPQVELICEGCQKPFKEYACRAKRKKRHFCSMACSGRQAPLPPVAITCKGCGKEFKIPYSEAKRGVREWCSVECRSKHSYFDRNCLKCGKPFRVGKGFIDYYPTSGKYCCRECYLAADRDNLINNADRFWAKVDKNGPIHPYDPSKGRCWIWTGTIVGGGYGSVRTRKGARPTHVIAWEMANGESARGRVIAHSCDNPPCCNISHLSAGTQKDNMSDAAAKGRISHGESHAHAKLNDATAMEIYQLASSGAMSRKDTAAKFGVSVSAVAMIVNKKLWKHIHKSPPSPVEEKVKDDPNNPD